MEHALGFATMLSGVAFSFYLLSHLKLIISSPTTKVRSCILAIGVSSTLAMGVTSPKFTSVVIEYIGLKARLGKVTSEINKKLKVAEAIEKKVFKKNLELASLLENKEQVLKSFQKTIQEVVADKIVSESGKGESLVAFSEGSFAVKLTRNERDKTGRKHKRVEQWAYFHPSKKNVGFRDISGGIPHLNKTRRAASSYEVEGVVSVLGKKGVFEEKNFAQEKRKTLFNLLKKASLEDFDKKDSMNNAAATKMNK